MLIRFPDGKTRCTTPHAGESLLSVLQRTGAPLSAPCGGKGTCGHCKVMVREGDKASYRLACRTIACDSMEAIVEDQGAMQVEGTEALRPHEAAANNARNHGCGQHLGLAADIGTTTLVTYLTDLSTGEPIASYGTENPQTAFGADVVARIEAARSPAALRAMGQSVCEAIGSSAQQLCIAIGTTPQSIERIAFCGNTVMEHLVCGIDPAPIGMHPFEPSALFGDERPMASDFPANTESAYLAPCISGYVGGDIVAGLLTLGIADRKETALLIDIGTNGEMALGDASGIACCAAAAGPAFEGAGIACGMAALPGAVCHVSPDEDGFRLEVIGNIPPKGLCGSGLLDALACMIAIGVVDETGRMLKPDEAEGSLAALLDESSGQATCYLDDSRSIYLTQEDVRKVQLAKGAIRAGIETLIRTAGLSYEDIDDVYLAGGFGTHLSPASALELGLIPPALAAKVQPVGNAAGKGAIMLLDDECRRKAQAIAGICEYLELSTSSIFNDLFIESMGFDD